ncbi:hypothetical protein COCON_G00220360 [Conger conger]|uniref:Fe2OG dioxygenase domain-containing protein n=1 Tax=Conger conger TaxID=82655 RepID=A0A9Q1HP06_CONCO|nr:hypothetical protein COCON_G00220360 [Conger conger]
MDIPVVDFDVYRVGVEDVADEKLNVLSKELKSAFTEVGFVYLKNSGISQHEVDSMMNISKTFFLLPHEVKMPLLRGKAYGSIHGWISYGSERTGSNRTWDLKEAFNIADLQPMALGVALGGSAPRFREKQVWFYRRCADLSLRVLRVLALSLGLDPDIFLSKHSRVVDGEQQAGGEQNRTTLRLLYYPPVQTECVQEGQVRCGEHSDFGTITLVFQGPGGGLQFLGRSGDYIHAPSIPGTVLINIADMMQRWTSDRFISTIHRVVLPPPGDMSDRQSVIFFLLPDDDAVITCCDGTDKCPPATALDFLMERFSQTYEEK